MATPCVYSHALSHYCGEAGVIHTVILLPLPMSICNSSRKSSTMIGLISYQALGRHSVVIPPLLITTSWPVSHPPLWPSTDEHTLIPACYVLSLLREIWAEMRERECADRQRHHMPKTSNSATVAHASDLKVSDGSIPIRPQRTILLCTPIHVQPSSHLTTRCMFNR